MCGLSETATQTKKSALIVKEGKLWCHNCISVSVNVSCLLKGLLMKGVGGVLQRSKQISGITC